MEKIEKYCDKLCKEYDGTVIKTERSKYYTVNGRVLRLSNHVGRNSSGCCSIIVPKSRDFNGAYVIQVHTSGEMTLVNYRTLQEFVRTFFTVTGFMEPLLQTNYKFDASKEHDGNVVAPNNTDTILGVPASMFSEKQIKQLMSWRNQIFGNKNP